jgi:hypothetical protein
MDTKIKMDLPGNKIEIVYCKRCGAKCRVAKGSSNAKMLRRASEGYCVCCAVHEWLLNTYPVNILITQSGPRCLLFPHIQEQFAGIMKSQKSDALPDEINWQKIVDNWSLPFPTKVKGSAANPVNQRELDEIASGKRHGFGTPEETERRLKQKAIMEKNHGFFHGFDELNEFEPGLGDELRRCLRG